MILPLYGAAVSAAEPPRYRAFILKFLASVGLSPLRSFPGSNAPSKGLGRRDEVEGCDRSGAAAITIITEVGGVGGAGGEAGVLVWCSPKTACVSHPIF